MKEKVYKYITENKMTKQGDHILLGLSGGADSVCLLYILLELKERLGITLSAVHIEHGIRGEESQRDAEFAKDCAAAAGIPFYIYHESAPSQAAITGRTLEEAARDIRIHCYADACAKSGANVLALAHHARDCAETVLLNMIRGSALKGIKGIDSVSFRDGYTVIRPLLCADRAQIEEYLAQKGIKYCIDSTNYDIEISRNRIRHNVIPELEKINDRAVTHIARAARYAGEAVDFAEYEADRADREHVSYISENGRLAGIRADREALKRMHPFLQKTLLHTLISRMAGGSRDISESHVEAVRALLYGKSGAQVSLPKNVRAFNEYEDLVLEKKGETLRRSDEKARAELALPGETFLEDGTVIETELFEYLKGQKIPENLYTKWFDYDKIKNTLLVRTRQKGDYLQVNASGGHKKLKDLFINEKIPRGRRDEILLIADGDHIVWALGIRMSEAYKITDATKRVLSITVKERQQKDE